MILLCVLGCRQETQVEVAEIEDRIVVDPETDRLRALGYIDYSPEPAALDDMGITVFDEKRSCPGYNLYTVRQLRIAELIDSRGRVLNNWHKGSDGRWVRSVLLPDGDLLVIGREISQRYVMRLSWDNEIIWKRLISAHHDITQAPEDRFVLLTFKHRLVPAISPIIPLRDDHLTIISHEGDVQEERSLYKMLGARPDVFCFQEVKPGPAFFDRLHANSVRWIMHRHLEKKHLIYAPCNVIVCLRHQDSIVIFDWERGEVVWTWGQGQLSEPHDAVVLENGNILLFDNGVERGWSRVIELDPLTREIVWQYRAPVLKDFYTASRGANQRLPNGNTLITESNKGRAFEVTPKGEIVWEYFVPFLNAEGHRATIIRLYRYEADLVDRMINKMNK